MLEKQLDNQGPRWDKDKNCRLVLLVSPLTWEAGQLVTNIYNTTLLQELAKRLNLLRAERLNGA